MIKNLIKSDSGSTFLLIIVTLAILTTLGTVLLAMTTMNYRMKLMDKDIKQSFYYAESGLEEAYGMVGLEVDSAVSYAVTNSDADLQAFIQSEKDKENDLMNPEDSIYINDDGTLNEDEVQKKSEALFRLRYKEYFNSKDIKGIIEDVSNYKISKPTVSVSISPFIYTNESSLYELDGTYKDDNYVIHITSQFIHDGKYKKIITADIVTQPKNIPVRVKNKVEPFLGNPLWKKALVSNSNLYVQGDDQVSIEGSIYVYGTPGVLDTRDVTNHGGIIVGDGANKGRLKIDNTSMTDDNKQIVTHSLVQTKGSGSTLEITDSNIYCNSLVVQKNAENSTINIYGNVYTKDDIELNGRGGKIIIDGSYYGFSDGSDSVTTHDNSSCILVNIPPFDYETGNQIFGKSNEGLLEITGKEHSSIDNYITGVYIGGTAHINIYNEGNDFQTGESISIMGNYLAYTYGLNGLVGDDSKYNEDNIKFSPYSNEAYTLLFANEFQDTSNSMLVLDKSNYLNLVNNSMPGLLNIGDGEDANSGINIPLDKIIFSTGLSIVEDGTNRLVSGYSISQDSQKINDNAPLDYYYNIHNMEYRDGDSWGLKDDSGVNVVSKYFSFVDSLDEEFNDGSKHQVVYIQDTTSTDAILVKGIGGYEPSGIDFEKIYNLGSDNKLHGLILAKGDVYITGNVEYTGSIITEGNIHLLGNGSKTITYDEEYLKELIRQTPILRYQFINNKKVDVTSSSIEQLDSYVDHSSLLDIKNWSSN